MITINRSLCEVDFEDTNLRTIDVDVMEFVWCKVRENYNNSTDVISIGFKEIRKGIGRYTKDKFLKSVSRLNGIRIVTNQKSNNPSQRFTFNFSVSKDKKYFNVSLDRDIFKLFDEPKSYNEYHECYVYQFDEKYSKLMYKFFVGYKSLIGKSIFVESDTLLKIMNVHSDKPMSKIQYDIFQSSVKKINAKTDLNISLEKEEIVYKKGNEIVKYRLKINRYTGNIVEKSRDSKEKKWIVRMKTNEEVRIDRWLDEEKYRYKSDLDEELNGLEKNDHRSKLIPMISLFYEDSDDPLYIDNEYKLKDQTDVYCNTPTDTLNGLKKLVGDGWDFDIWWKDGYSKEFEKMVMLSKEELRMRGYK
jgi:hypothetical protein